MFVHFACRQNGFDCGVFASQFAAFSLRRDLVHAPVTADSSTIAPFLFSQRHMPLLRARMMLQLLDGDDRAREVKQ
jgi:Ulp1 family protease